MIYLDNAATTKPSESAVKAAIYAMENFGNPSSLHKMGLDAEKIIKDSRESIANAIGARSDNIVFTSGGTEANNTAVFAACKRGRKKHIITSKIEHPSVLEPFRELEREGFRVDYIGTDADGVIDIHELEEMLDNDTQLVSIMHVNNETGAVQPIKKIKELLCKKTDGALLHTDAVQSFGKIPFTVRETDADFISFSAHKIGGLKGSGALYIKNPNTIKPIIVGGGQQKNLRSGTENVVGIAAFGAAIKDFVNRDICHIKSLKDRLLEGIKSNIPDIKVNGGVDGVSPYLLNVSFLGIKAEILLHSLESDGIYVSTGSACSSNKPMPSHVLTAMGCSREEINGAVRFSFNENLSADDIDCCIKALTVKVAEIRKYMR